jgi:hypothetical protein
LAGIYPAGVVPWKAVNYLNNEGSSCLVISSSVSKQTVESNFESEHFNPASAPARKRFLRSDAFSASADLLVAIAMNLSSILVLLEHPAIIPHITIANIILFIFSLLSVYLRAGVLRQRRVVLRYLIVTVVDWTAPLVV